MTTIKGTCPTCGEVSLTPDDIDLRVDPATDVGTYNFSCPRCLADICKPADARVIRLLASGGVPVLPLDLEPEPERLCDRSTGPRLTHDDLLDFHYAIEAYDVWMRWAS